MSESKRPLKVFLCHAHADRDPVRGLYSRLTKDGVDAWFDKAKLLPGQDWELEIRKAVREADVVVVCLSKNFSQKGFKHREVGWALDEAAKQPDDTIYIIPARLEECDMLESLRKLHWVDLFEDEGYETLMRALRVQADKIGAILQVGEVQLSKTKANQERVLEAAIEKPVYVGKPASLFVWIRRHDSKNIISVVNSIDEYVRLDEENVKDKGFEIEFPLENEQALSVGITLRLVAYEFFEAIQQKKIIVPPKGDSEVCTFIVTPTRAGELHLNLEVLKDEISLASRNLRTTAVETEKKVSGSVALVTIPIVVFVQPPALTLEPTSSGVLGREDKETGKKEQEMIVHKPTGSVVIDKVLDAFAVTKGQVLEDRYHVLRVLSVTNHSQVVEAWDEKLERKVAIKFIYLPDHNDQVASALMRSLEREATVLVRLNHPNIGKIYDVIRNPMGAVLEWIDGRSLFNFLDDHRVFGVSEVIQIGVKIADALSHAHSKGVVHRDIKPGNIILNIFNEPILVDFNIAHILNRDTIALEKDGKSYYVGTLRYSAPEQITTPEKVSFAVDIFSLGLVLYELLTFQTPFAYGNWSRNYEQGRLPKPEQKNIPDNLYKILCQALNQNPNQRPIASVFKEKLESIQK